MFKNNNKPTNYSADFLSPGINPDGTTERKGPVAKIALGALALRDRVHAHAAEPVSRVAAGMLPVDMGQSPAESRVVRTATAVTESPIGRVAGAAADRLKNRTVQIASAAGVVATTAVAMRYGVLPPQAPGNAAHFLTGPGPEFITDTRHLDGEAHNPGTIQPPQPDQTPPHA